MNLEDFKEAFLEELSEQLSEMEQQILTLEANGGDQNTVQTLFRVAHTLKGSSAAMGFDQMKQLTHEMEQVLDEVRNARLQISQGLITLLFQCYDSLRALQETYSTENGEPIDITSLIESLRTSAMSESESAATRQMDAEPKTDITEALRYKLMDGARMGMKAFSVKLSFAPTTIMRGARAYLVVDALQVMGDIVSISPSMDDMENRQDEALQGFEMIILTSETLDTIQKTVAGPDYTHVQVAEMTIAEQTADTVPVEDIAQNGELSGNSSAKRSLRKSQTVRVDVERLETLMNLVGELVIDQTRIGRVQRALDRSYRSNEQVRVLGDISAHFSRVVSELQENVMAARMLPIEALFDRFPRIVRDLSQNLNKNVQLILEGRETRLDRTVIEEVADPLIHLIRNAVDHGLETSDVRAKNGKSTQGTVRLIAVQEDNKVVISVKDDGAGIDPNKIRLSAVDKGIITSDEASKLTEPDVLNLIFRPGFSTANTVSDISGRGVGMDIVRSNIEKLNGTIEIQTELGRGTTFKIKLPLSLAIIPGLLVGIDTRTFVIPMSNVVEIVRLFPELIQSVNQVPSILLRGEVLPIVYLRDYLQIPKSQMSLKHLSIVVVESAEKRVGLVVDDLRGNQEIVKKTFGANMGDVQGIAGATILGDGHIGLILDVADVCKMKVTIS